MRESKMSYEKFINRNFVYLHINNDIEEIYVSSAGENKYIGFGIGAAIDITFIILAIIGLANYEK
jgi:hypothetical protein